ncbi:MAG: hypothetical protein V3V63_01160 [Candidatus Hydrothermarchaeaceae archaeon]
MGVEANPITITWTVGIGLSAFIASGLLMHERTRKWSDKKIVMTSALVSFSSVLLLLQVLGKI